MHRSHIANADDRRQPRSPLADGDDWINPRIIRIPAASRGRGRISATSRGRGRISASSWGRGRISASSRRRSRESARDYEVLIHHLWSYICRSSIGEPAGSIGDSPPTGGVIGGEGGATPTRYVAGGEGGASLTGGLASDEGDATLMSDEEFIRRCVVTEAGKALWEKCKVGGEGDATLMSDEEFVRRYVVTEARKTLWEKCKAKGDEGTLGSNDSTVNLSRNSLFAAIRLGLMADVCGIIRPSLTHLHTVVFEQPKPIATLKRLHLLEKCILLNRSTSRCSLLGIAPSCTGLPGDCKLQLCLL
ncbi:hypothetical protein SASPL_101589 [Salvia splendens]|uniref:Uncharacterized protein n=1 Tax=Salvia splendens TaxID=180675 RepID=A0A8X8YU87_SALSN|nr:hypothetical protein SASPL_101589 [Salvia splendens]